MTPAMKTVLSGIDVLSKNAKEIALRRHNSHIPGELELAAEMSEQLVSDCNTLLGQCRELRDELNQR